jgi:hypothetical protein
MNTEPDNEALDMRPNRDSDADAFAFGVEKAEEKKSGEKLALG